MPEEFDHPPCCSDCGGSGADQGSPCWSCRGSGHPHPRPTEDRRFTVLDNGWLVEYVDRHTCGTGPGGHYGAHEPGCGLEPLATMEDVEAGLRLLYAVREATRRPAGVTAPPDSDPWVVHDQADDDDGAPMARHPHAWGGHYPPRAAPFR